MEKIACLIDHENFTCSPGGLEKLMAELSARGSISVKRAYADWTRHAGWRQNYLNCQFDMVELPYATKGKNSSDIRLVVDAMELVFSKPYISAFVIASGDADFLPLLLRLREYNKRTIVVANSSKTVAQMRTHCDEFLDGTRYLRPSKPKKVTDSNTQLRPGNTPKRVPNEEQISQLQSILLDLWRMFDEHHSFEISALGSQLKRLRAEISWREFGFKSLQPLVAHLVSTGFLRIELSNPGITSSRSKIHLADKSKRVLQQSQREVDMGNFPAMPQEPFSSDYECGLAELILSLAGEPIRWDRLRDKLASLMEGFSTVLHDEERFLKLLQSLDAAGKIILDYESVTGMYFVSSSSYERATSRRHFPSQCQEPAMQPLEFVRSDAWVQTRLFEDLE